MTAVPLADQQLADIRAREAAATRGPWSTARDAGYAEEYGETFVANWSGEYMRGVGDFILGVGEEAEADLAFVLGARTDVPALLAELDRLRDQAETLQLGAIEREALLEEARDALEAAGQNGAHGDDWPAVAPAIRALAAERDRLRAELANLRRITAEHITASIAIGSKADAESAAVSLEEQLDIHDIDLAAEYAALDAATQPSA
jgi:hypothetical protein